MRTPSGTGLLMARAGMENYLNTHDSENTWQIISNWLDIDFIHGDIHGKYIVLSH